MKLEKTGNEPELKEEWKCPKDKDKVFTDFNDLREHNKNCLVCSVVTLIAIFRSWDGE